MSARRAPRSLRLHGPCVCAPWPRSLPLPRQPSGAHPGGAGDKARPSLCAPAPSVRPVRVLRGANFSTSLEKCRREWLRLLWAGSRRGPGAALLKCRRLWAG